MSAFRPLGPGSRSRVKATRALFIAYGAERTPEGRSLRLLREWLSPMQREQFVRKGYFEVIGSASGKPYRVHLGRSANVCALDENGHPKEGLCFMPVGDLPIGDVMLAQKIALETDENEVNEVARKFTTSTFHFRTA
ncbi:hypothetical protein Q2941_29890 [Bradyrhizobium sp. UFLA05-153]